MYPTDPTYTPDAATLRRALPFVRLTAISMIVAALLAVSFWFIDPATIAAENRGFELAQQILLAFAIPLSLAALLRIPHPLVVAMAAATLAMAIALFFREIPNCRVAPDAWCLSERWKALATALLLVLLLIWSLRYVRPLYAAFGAILRSLVWWPFPLLAIMALASEWAERSGAPLIEEGIELLACALIVTMAWHLWRSRNSGLHPIE